MAVRLCSTRNAAFRIRTFSSFLNNTIREENFKSSNNKSRKCKEIEIPVPWGHVAGKWWEPYENKPILSIHGWQDNCGTFDRLIPLLRKDVGFLAIDLPGHGFSSMLPPGMHYDHFLYLFVIKMVSKHFKWDKVSLMAHSLGAINCFVYAMLFPDDVDFLILIEGLKPVIRKNNISRMAESMEGILIYNELVTNKSKNEPPSYSLDQIRHIVCSLNNASIDISTVDYLLKRNLAQSKINRNKYYFTRDPRLKSELVPNWCQQEIVEYTRRVENIPICCFKASDSGYFEEKKNYDEVMNELKQVNRKFELHYVEGSHHVHLNHPERVTRTINSFLEKYR